MDSYSDDNIRRDEWNLADGLGVLYRRKATIAGITLLGILGAAAITAIQPREYQAHASVEMRTFNDTYLDTRGVYPLSEASPDAVTFMQTQAEILQQDNLLDRVAQNLKLESRPEYQSQGTIASRLRDDVQIVPVKNSRILQIVANARGPQLAADIANGLAQAFVDQSIDERQQDARQTYDFLMHELQELRTARAKAGVKPGDDRVDTAFYEGTLQKAYNAYLASRMRLSNARMAGPATPPLLPRKPNLPLNLAIGALGGLLARNRLRDAASAEVSRCCERPAMPESTSPCRSWAPSRRCAKACRSRRSSPAWATAGSEWNGLRWSSGPSCRSLSAPLWRRSSPVRAAVGTRE